MKTTIKLIIFSVLFTLISLAAKAQASLTIENNSMRTMTVKVMSYDGGNGTLYQTVTVNAYSSNTVYFSESGQYFTKTKAVYKGKNPIYRKGQSFVVKNDDSGYSVLTLTFSIKESAVPQATGGKEISKNEFDEN